MTRTEAIKAAKAALPKGATSEEITLEAMRQMGIDLAGPVGFTAPAEPGTPSNEEFTRAWFEDRRKRGFAERWMTPMEFLKSHVSTAGESLGRPWVSRLSGVRL